MEIITSLQLMCCEFGDNNNLSDVIQLYNL